MHWKYIGSDFEYLPVRQTGNSILELKLVGRRKSEVGRRKFSPILFLLRSPDFGLRTKNDIYGNLK